MLLALVTVFLAGCDVAQMTTTSQTSSSKAPASSNSPTSSATWPVVPIFLPIEVPTHLGASVVNAEPRKTVFAVDCLTESSCMFTKPFLLTGGVSTFVATNTYLDSEGSADSPLTISCELSGGVPATAATCTGSSVISGLGTVASTSTLAYSQISYVPLTITAGAAKLNAVPTGVSIYPSSSSSALACEFTAAVSWVVGGAAAALLGGAL